MRFPRFAYHSCFILFIPVACCISCKNEQTSRPNVPIVYDQKRSIDSIAAMMDTAVFGKDHVVNERRDIPYHTVNYQTNASYPQFFRYNFHSQEGGVLDSVFYYYNNKLIRVSIRRSTDTGEMIFEKQYYFDKEIAPANDKDSAVMTRLLWIAKKHQQEAESRK
jgi:hypothetical protein